MSHVGESSASREIREPLLPERPESSSAASVAAPGMYQDNRNYGNPYGPKAALRRWLGIFSYKDPDLMNKPRKIPMRVEPKTFFALERTFLNWMSMAVTVSTLSTTLLGFSVSSDMKPGDRPTSLTPHALQFIAVGLLAVGLIILFYAIYIYGERVTALTKKEMRFMEDRLSPLLITSFIIVALSCLWLSRLYDFIMAAAY